MKGIMRTSVEIDFRFRLKLKLDVALAKCQRAAIQNNVKCLKFWRKYCKYCVDCFLLPGGNKVGSLADVEFTLVWIAGRWFATVVVCFSFAWIEFSLKRFLSFFDCFITFIDDQNHAGLTWQSLRATIDPLQDNRSLFHYVIGISGILTYSQESYLTIRNLTLQTCLSITGEFFFLHSTFTRLYNAAASPVSRLRSAGSLAITYLKRNQHI